MPDLKRIELDDEDLDNINGGVNVTVDKNTLNGILGIFSRLFGFGNNKNQNGLMNNNNKKDTLSQNFQDSGNRDNSKFM